MKVFITAPFKGNENKSEIELLCKIVRDSGFEDFCFIRDIENYQKIFNDPKELMDRARREITDCDVLLFDASEKSTGRAIELGIAFANKKKVIVVIKEDTKIENVFRGVANAIIYYKNIKDIQSELTQLFFNWTK